MDGSIIEKAALLHDIGKLVIRASGQDIEHGVAGRHFLEAFSLCEEILGAAEKHHSESANGFYALIRKANEIAVGTDSRKIEGAHEGFDPERCMQSVFNNFKGSGNLGNTAFSVAVVGDKMHFPADELLQRATSLEYKSVLEEIERYFSVKSPAEMTVNELLGVLEETTVFVPAEVRTDELSDVSLYDHAKLTAAFAICLHKYSLANKLVDVGSISDEENAFLLVSADVSGVQQFIYTIPSAGALKSLRGRSFYLDIMLENIADEILVKCGVSRSCLLYTGGGHFYMLLPNTEATLELLRYGEERINSWFLQKYGIRLYLAFGWTPCSAYEFSARSEHGSGAVYRRVSRSLSEKKLRRYNSEQLMSMFEPQQIEDSSRECGICHISSQQVNEHYMPGGGMACPNCRNLFKLGECILRGDIVRVSMQRTSNSVELPGLDADLYLEAVPADKIYDVPVRRVYLKNQLDLSFENAIRIWLGDYVSRDARAHSPLEFKSLARRSCGQDNGQGIPRLGVLRADVDNLGAAFMSGLPVKYATLSRTATLSRQLSMFFKYYINIMCRGEIDGLGESGGKKFRMFTVDKKSARDVHIIYSGGDDLFLVGAWDDLIELSVDIRKAFKRFTNGKLTFSGGIGLFDDSFPIAQMARKTGELEDIAKSHESVEGRYKDSLALFGNHSEVYEAHSAQKSAQSYFWDQFEHSVCGTDDASGNGKLKFLQKNIVVGSKSADDERLLVGKGTLYKMLVLLESEDSINLARFSYSIARLEPAKVNDPSYESYKRVRQRLYDWFVNKEDRRELYTAIILLIYSLRSKGDEKYGV